MLASRLNNLISRRKVEITVISNIQVIQVSIERTEITSVSMKYRPIGWSRSVFAARRISYYCFVEFNINCLSILHTGVALHTGTQKPDLHASMDFLDDLLRFLMLIGCFQFSVIRQFFRLVSISFADSHHATWNYWPVTNLPGQRGIRSVGAKRLDVRLSSIPCWRSANSEHSAETLTTFRHLTNVHTLWVLDVLIRFRHVVLFPFPCITIMYCLPHCHICKYACTFDTCAIKDRSINRTSISTSLQDVDITYGKEASMLQVPLCEKHCRRPFMTDGWH